MMQFAVGKLAGALTALRDWQNRMEQRERTLEPSAELSTKEMEDVVSLVRDVQEMCNGAGVSDAARAAGVKPKGKNKPENE